MSGRISNAVADDPDRGRGSETTQIGPLPDELKADFVLADEGYDGACAI